MGSEMCIRDRFGSELTVDTCGTIILLSPVFIVNPSPADFGYCLHPHGPPLRSVQNGEGCHTAAALVPAAACARSHVYWRAIFGQGLLIDATHQTEAVLSRVPRRRQRVPDAQVGVDTNGVRSQTNSSNNFSRVGQLAFTVVVFAFRQP